MTEEKFIYTLKKWIGKFVKITETDGKESYGKLLTVNSIPTSITVNMGKNNIRVFLIENILKVETVIVKVTETVVSNLPKSLKDKY